MKIRRLLVSVEDFVLNTAMPIVAVVAVICLLFWPAFVGTNCGLHAAPPRRGESR